MTDTKKKKESKDPKCLNLKSSPDKSREELFADVALSGVAGNAMLAQEFGKNILGEFHITEAVKVLMDRSNAFHDGKIGDIERMLLSQASALDVIFGSLALRAKANMGEGHYLNAADRYMRLALKAQAQCRTTLETLANIKNPPVVIARQANIANGPQQVNNNGRANTDVNFRSTENSNSVQSKLLEDKQNELERLDIGAPSKTIEGNSKLETVDAINRT